MQCRGKNSLSLFKLNFLKRADTERGKIMSPNC